MRILVTGAKGFVGKNLCFSLKNIRDGKDKARLALKIDEVYEYDIDSVPEQLQMWCQNVDFVLNLDGVLLELFYHNCREVAGRLFSGCSYKAFQSCPL